MLIFLIPCLRNVCTAMAACAALCRLLKKRNLSSEKLCTPNETRFTPIPTIVLANSSVTSSGLHSIVNSSISPSSMPCFFLIAFIIFVSKCVRIYDGVPPPIYTVCTRTLFIQYALKSNSLMTAFAYLSCKSVFPVVEQKPQYTQRLLQKGM